MSAVFNGLACCPACGWSVRLNGMAVPSHLPHGFSGRALCPASGWIWSDDLAERKPWEKS